ncbi:MAG: hypothetical protein SFX73_26225 [Kofleriaceae bacterium]|nr:hypothetical protein [Kofleriaceae bacterium]
MRASILCALVLGSAVAAAAPGATRVVLADPDPELLRAVEKTLAPWALEIVVEKAAPVDIAQAAAHASGQTARFVVWRRGSDLVVFDRERGAAEYREGKAGALDPIDAAASALTVKTLMRLPPPPGTNDVALATAVTTPGPEVRVQAGAASRFSGSTHAEVSARVGGAALVRPWGQRDVRFGIAGEVGSRAEIKDGNFRGTWGDWAVLALASYTIARGRWELDPHVGVGFSRSRLEGMESSVAREDARTLAAFRLGVWGRWREGRFTLGAGATLDSTPGAPTYVREQGNGTLFAAPGMGLGISVFAAADFGG